MKIALDYDDTITRDRALWFGFIYNARAAGHEVYIVTMRYEHETITDVPQIMVLYTGRAAKREWCLREGYSFDIWIDDRPEFILNHAADYRGR